MDEPMKSLDLSEKSKNPSAKSKILSKKSKNPFTKSEILSVNSKTSLQDSKNIFLETKNHDVESMRPIENANGMSTAWSQASDASYDELVRSAIEECQREESTHHGRTGPHTQPARRLHLPPAAAAVGTASVGGTALLTTYDKAGEPFCPCTSQPG